MSQVYFRLENCYGIKSFRYKFVFDVNKKAHLIYAPNGTMKTSFARTLQDVCDKKLSRDALFPTRTTIRIIKHDDENGADYEPENILVVAPYKEDYKSDRMSLLLANQELKNEYDSLHNEIESKMQVVYRNLNSLSAKKDAIGILIRDFESEEINTYELLSRIFDNEELRSQAIYSNIPYGKLFTKEAEETLKLENFIEKIRAYVEQYNQLITSSPVFQAAFDHCSAKSISGDMSRSGFFKANHKVLLNGETNGRNEKEFNEVIEAETRRIVEVEMADNFSELDKILDQKQGTRDLRAFLSKYREIIPELTDIPSFKKKLWASYLVSKNDDFTEAILCYRRCRDRISEIIHLAAAQESMWSDIVNEFNNRFIDLPYLLFIDNKEDVVLSLKAPVVSFHVKSGLDERPIEQKILLDYLSDGEKRALYLLNIIFEIKARNITSLQTLVIFDDVADSFDYKNKYAIIEYLIEIVLNPNFFPIFLTHNFDFYRTLACRADLKSSSWFAEKADGAISIEHGEYFVDVFERWKDMVYNNKAVFIAAIPFLRNIIQYQDGQHSPEFLQLTALLHYKEHLEPNLISTERYMMGDLCDFMISKWGLERASLTYDRSVSAFNFILDCARDIARRLNESYKLEEKVTLAISCRLLAEKYMIERIANGALTDGIQNNQTRALRTMINFSHTDPADIQREKLIDRMLIISSENVHINAFMYEPLIDISLSELKSLFNLISRIENPLGS